jgi:hypothetical protein
MNILEPLGHSQVTPHGTVLGDSASSVSTSSLTLDRFGRAQAGQLFRAHRRQKATEWYAQNPPCPGCGARGGWHQPNCNQ